MASIRENTGFDFDVDGTPDTTPAPEADVLSMIRGPVATGIAEVYPAFARRLFG